MADLNANGRLDLISGSWPGAIYWFPGLAEGEGEPHFGARRTLIANPGAKGTSVHAVDWNGNGRIDILASSYCGSTYVFENLGNDGAGTPRFAAKREIELVNGARFRADVYPFVVDWNGNGKLDLVTFGHHSITLYENVGTRQQPRFANAARLLARADGSRDGRYFKGWVGDLTGDGVLDLIWGNQAFLRDDDGRTSTVGYVYLAAGIGPRPERDGDEGRAGAEPRE